MKKGIIYVRVSSADQIQGTSLDSQKRACFEYALKREIEIIDTFIEEGESATAASRTQFLQAIDFCKKSKGAISAFIVWKIDRFARNTEDHFAVRAQLTKYGVTLHSVTEPITNDHTGKLMETFLAGYAEFENEVRKQRCTGGMQARLRDGIWCWMPPIGYVNSKKRKDRRKTAPDVPDEERFDLIQRGLRLYKNGTCTISALAQESEKWGLKTRTGKPFRKQLWEQILVNKFYAGVLTDPWTAEEHPGQHQPMISIEEYWQIQAIKKRKSNRATRSRLTVNPEFPLRGFVRCLCGLGYTGSWNRGRSKRYANYTCRNRQCAHYGHTVRRDELEEQFCTLLKRISPDDHCLELLRQIITGKSHQANEAMRRRQEQSVKELGRLEANRKQIIQMRVNAEISTAEYKELKDAIDCKLAEIKAESNEIQSEFDLEKGLSNAQAMLSDLSLTWTRLDARKRQLFHKVVLPEGVMYSKLDRRFRTAVLPPIINVKQLFSETMSDLVAPAGQIWNRVVQDLKVFNELI